MHREPVLAFVGLAAIFLVLAISRTSYAATVELQFNGLSQVKRNMLSDCQHKGGKFTCCYYSTTYVKQTHENIYIGKIIVKLLDVDPPTSVILYSGSFELPRRVFVGREQFVSFSDTPYTRVVNEVYDSENHLLGEYSFRCP